MTKYGDGIKQNDPHDGDSLQFLSFMCDHLVSLGGTYIDLDDSRRLGGTRLRPVDRHRRTQESAF
jgi:hypothetical protein